MLERAGNDFDVLVVPYFSRYMQNVKQALIFRDEIHARGAVVYICDERILSSDEHGWDEWVREAHEAEAFSRKQSRRVGEGLEAKRRRLGVPGGNRPPLGYLRVRTDPANPRSPQQLIEDPATAPVIRRAFELSASGMTDREVAADVDLKLTHVREILKNPVYFGRLRTGEDSGGPPLITRDLWDTVAVVRGKYARRHRGPVSRRTYALSTLLQCAACGRRLTGHVGRCRHVDACAEFKAAKPKAVPWRSPGDRRLKGESYKIEVYDNLVPQLLSRVSVGAKTMTQVVDGLAVQPSSTFTMAMIERDREAALRKYKQDRDTTTLERSMRRLDDEEHEAQAATQVISAEEAVAWLTDLPALWEAADDSGRRLLTEALFEKVEVLAVKSVTIHPTPEVDAHGWSDAFGPTPQLIPVEMVAGAIGTNGRGERSRAYTLRISVTVLDGDAASIVSRSSDVA